MARAGTSGIQVMSNCPMLGIIRARQIASPFHHCALTVFSSPEAT